jgi:hypothetical protein
MSKPASPATGLSTLTSLPSSNLSPKALAVYSAGNYVKRLQLVTKGKLVDSGKVVPGNYAVPISEDEVVVIGPTADILVLAVRSKALDTTEEPPLASYDPESDIYQQIVERSKTADSGCMHGPSFLVYERTTAQFLEFYCGNASGRQESGKIGSFLPISEEAAAQYGGNFKAQGPQTATLSAKLVKRPRQSWHAPVCGKCSTPFDRLPTQQECIDEITKFLNPQENKDVATTTETKRAR